MTKKNILITGAAGSIGSHVADDLLSHGHFVRVLVRRPQQLHESDVFVDTQRRAPACRGRLAELEKSHAE